MALNTSIPLLSNCTNIQNLGAVNSMPLDHALYNVSVALGASCNTSAGASTFASFLVTPGALSQPTCTPLSTGSPLFVLLAPVLVATNYITGACPSALGSANAPGAQSPGSSPFDPFVAVAGPASAPVCTSPPGRTNSALVSVGASGAFSVQVFNAAQCQRSALMSTFASVPASGCTGSLAGGGSDGAGASLMTFVPTMPPPPHTPGFLAGSLYHSRSDCSDAPQAQGWPMMGGCTPDGASGFSTLLSCTNATSAALYTFSTPDCSGTALRATPMPAGPYAPLGRCAPMPAGGGGYSGPGYYGRYTCSTNFSALATPPVSPFAVQTISSSSCLPGGNFSTSAASRQVSVTAFAPGNCLSTGSSSSSSAATARYVSYSCVGGLPRAFTFASSTCSGAALESSADQGGCQPSRTPGSSTIISCSQGASLPMGPMPLGRRPTNHIKTVGIVGVFQDSACTTPFMGLSLNVSCVARRLALRPCPPSFF